MCHNICLRKLICNSCPYMGRQVLCANVTLSSWLLSVWTQSRTLYKLLKLIIMLYILLLDHSWIWYLNLYNGLSFFPSLHQYMQEWHPVRERSWCYYSMKIEQTAESLVMTIPRAGRYSEGPYRCVSNADNVTAPDNSSQELAIKVHCECLGWWVGGVRGLSVEQRVGDTIFLFCQIKKP